jgi:DNA-directed RNA polymerase specialized sigma24 family protein
MRPQRTWEELWPLMQAEDPAAWEDMIHGHGDSLLSLARYFLRRYPELRPAYGSTDILDSVLADFYHHVLTHPVTLHDWRELFVYVATMIRHNITQKREHLQREREYREEVSGAGAGLEIAPDPDPAEVASRHEQVEAVRRYLTDDEYRLAMAHFERRTWDEIAAEWGEPAEALRKRLARALDRASQALGGSR